MNTLIELKNAAEISIEGITEPVLECYFQTLNAGEYEKTAALFAAEGQLNAPFEEPVVGRKAIVQYLQKEAKGMKLFPRQGVVEINEDERLFEIRGKVETSWFAVNVGWQFRVNQAGEIVSATIKLLASPQELLNMYNAKQS